jgi:hypothetical protein
MDDETHPNVKRRYGKYVVMNKEEMELLDECAAMTDRSASSVMRVALKEHAIKLGLLKPDQ